MKKWMLFVLVLCLALPTAAWGEAAPGAAASGTEPSAANTVTTEPVIDLVPLTDEELRLLLAQVESELVARGLAGTALLPGGTYVGGRDLPVGAYVISNDGSWPDMQGGPLVLKPVAEVEAELQLNTYVTSDEVYSYYIRICEGDVLVLPYPHTVSIYTGLTFQ